MQEGVNLVVWNLPYLDPLEPDGVSLEPIEEASMSDLPRGWSDKLQEVVDDGLNNSSCLVVLLLRTDPESRS